ncbi:MAG TPA: hypothetical protein VML75_04130 [Kofleriaceae bacterium]|nr:hypothetical protein [Kofleriaceae bacterium]
MSAQPVTKDDLDHAINHAVQQSEARLRGDIAQSEDRLRNEIQVSIGQSEGRLMRYIAEASEHTVRVTMDRMDRMAGELTQRIGDEVVERIGLELARHIQASDERNLDSIRTIDDQYRTLPGEVTALRTEVEACCGPGGEVAGLRRDIEEHTRDDARHVGTARTDASRGPTDTEA